MKTNSLGRHSTAKPTAHTLGGRRSITKAYTIALLGIALVTAVACGNAEGYQQVMERHYEFKAAEARCKAGDIVACEELSDPEIYW